MASGNSGHWARHDRVSSSASQVGLDSRIRAVDAARPSARSWDAEYRAARAAGADPGAPAQAGSAARTATVWPGCASAHAAATAAPIEIPPTAMGPSRAASSKADRYPSTNRSGVGAGVTTRAPALRNGPENARLTYTSSDPVPGSNTV